MNAIPVDVHIPRLSDSVTPILGLGVHGRIPVRVVKDDRVRPCQIYTHTARSSGENETEDASVSVETFHQNLEKRIPCQS